ncbi:glycoside hydrolase family 43 protein [Chryseolinea sp. H1M3-3]|uniref:glycoside hydrolase family 43 protein n=1 Tax=Chryseolinea sp. H1M3-3 TaxID=3034144 RepID=UPI0023EB965C|nr:glycoside hydrolase family 43 protein [Chryseolinea sp. H1M3-3]
MSLDIMLSQISNVKVENKLINIFRHAANILLLCGIFVVAGSSSCKEDTASTPAPTPDKNKFRNPILTKGPDPWVTEYENVYYVTHTTGTNLKLYKTEKMSTLANASSKTVWMPPTVGMNAKNIWAPEIHHANGAWYFYYAADDGNNANHRIWVLENTSPDPFQGTWVDRGELDLPDDKWAIDGTLLQHNGELYFMWSGWEGDTDVRQDIYIAKMINPWTVEGERVRISKPELPWELIGSPPGVNEGPQFLLHGDKIFVVYSASGCWTDDYTLGLVTANSSANLLDPAAWSKLNQPVFSKFPDGQVFGPGHASFFASPDSTESWLLYHANPRAGQGCEDDRSVRMQKFTWKEDGTPDFGRPVALDADQNIPSGEIE